MHVPENLLQQCISTLVGCKREGVPQTYLGLPLSNDKLRLTAFAPYVAKAMRIVHTSKLDAHSRTDVSLKSEN
jgi:hypothetical protein